MNGVSIVALSKPVICKSLVFNDIPTPPDRGRYRDRCQGDCSIDLTCCGRSVSRWHEKVLGAETSVKPAR